MWPLGGGLSVEKPLPDLPEKVLKSSTSFAFDSNLFFLFFFFLTKILLTGLQIRTMAF